MSYKNRRLRREVEQLKERVEKLEQKKPNEFQLHPIWTDIED